MVGLGGGVGLMTAFFWGSILVGEGKSKKKRIVVGLDGQGAWGAAVLRPYMGRDDGSVAAETEKNRTL